LPGIYFDTLKTVDDCDSIVETTLEVNTVDATVSKNGWTLTANSTQGSYQWIDCEKQQIIPGETNRSFVPSKNGEYQVKVTEDNCIDTSECIFVDIVGIANNRGSFVTIYPNPVKDEVIIVNFSGENIEALVKDVSGKSVIELTLIGGSNKVNVYSLSKGIYFINLIGAKINITEKLIVE